MIITDAQLAIVATVHLAAYGGLAATLWRMTQNKIEGGDTVLCSKMDKGDKVLAEKIDKAVEGTVKCEISIHKRLDGLERGLNKKMTVGECGTTQQRIESEIGHTKNMFTMYVDQQEKAHADLTKLLDAFGSKQDIMATSMGEMATSLAALTEKVAKVPANENNLNKEGES